MTTETIPNRREFIKSLSSLVGIPLLAGAATAGPPVTRSATDRFCRWWCDLNCFRWPADWGEPPDWIKEKFSLPGRDCYVMHKARYHDLVEGVAALTDDETLRRYWNAVYIHDPSRHNFRYGNFPPGANLRGER